MYGLKLPVGYYSSPTKLAEKITETCLVSKPYDLKECINVTFDVVTGKFIMRLLEGVNVQFYRGFSRITGFRRNIAFSQRSRGVCAIQRGVYSMYVYCDVCKENIVGENVGTTKRSNLTSHGKKLNMIWLHTRRCVQANETTTSRRNG